jgi:D-alanyl-lipoteichoic acid acyltransferase DltB (MBOAT superfamily)
MLFNSLAFLVFLPVVLSAASVLPLRWRNRWLLIASYYFYGSWDWRFLGLIFISTLTDFLVGRGIYASPSAGRRKRLLLCSISINLGILGFFKYFNFFVDSAAALLGAIGVQAHLPTLQVILPVGISFYTFQSMSYSIDIYRRHIVPMRNFLDYALYVSYFPQLVAGPIERAQHLAPQILLPTRITAERINVALTLILIGFAKKVLIADAIAPEVNRIFADPAAMSSGLLLKGAYLFAFQIYGDFSGYSDIARGISELFGIRLMLNFNQPYLAASITEFWRRWHISLSTWLRDYVYIPLGGNRHGARQTYRNLILTMLIGGVWHGANWTFVVWGGLHGLLLAAERALGIDSAKQPHGRLTGTQWLRRLAGMLLTFHLVVFLWIFFRAPSFAVAFQYMAGLAQLTRLTAVGPLPFVVAFAVLLIDIPQNRWGEHAIFLRLPWWLRSPAYAAVFLAVVAQLLYATQETPFIYFQF